MPDSLLEKIDITKNSTCAVLVLDGHIECLGSKIPKKIMLDVVSDKKIIAAIRTILNHVNPGLQSRFIICTQKIGFVRNGILVETKRRK